MVQRDYGSDLFGDQFFGLDDEIEPPPVPTNTYNIVDPNLDGAGPSFVPVSAEDQFPNNGSMVLHVDNRGTLSTQVVVDDPHSPSPLRAILFDPDIGVTVPAGEQRYIGPFRPHRFNDSLGYVRIHYSNIDEVYAQVFEASEAVYKPPPIPVVIVPPEEPSTPQALTFGIGNLVMNWGAPTLGGPVEFYTVRLVKNTVTQSPDLTFFDNSTTQILIGLTPGDDYYYFVKAGNEGGESAFVGPSNETTIVAPPPEPDPPMISGPATLPGGMANIPYTPTQITAVGGETPYTWSATGLPTGLTINAANGTISGTPTTSGTFLPTITVTDNNALTDDIIYNFDIAPAASTTITYTQIITVPANQFDRTGNQDISDAYWDYINGLPNGPSARRHVKVVMPRYQADGVTPAEYRMESGVTGRHYSKRNMTIDFGGPQRFGLDGARFVAKIQRPYAVRAKAFTNPRGTNQHGNINTNAANSNAAGVNDLSFLQFGDQVQLMYNGGPEIIRSVIATNVGGDPRVITYSGASIGTRNNIDMITIPNGDWEIYYTPTNRAPSSVTTDVRFSATGHNANGTAFVQCLSREDDANETRTMMVWNNCRYFRIMNGKMTGANPTNTFIPDLHGQDGIIFMRCLDVQVKNFTIENMYGNGCEMWRDDPTPEGWVASVGVHLKDVRLRVFGRQCMSPQIGGNLIIEDCFFSTTGRTLMDCEPVSSFGLKDPRTNALVDGVFLLRLQVGSHALGGIISFNDAVMNGRIEDCFGFGIGSGSTWYIENLIYRRNTEQGGSIGSSLFDLIRGTSAARGRISGVNIKIEDNVGFNTTGQVAVDFHHTGWSHVAGASLGVDTNDIANGTITTLDVGELGEASPPSSSPATTRRLWVGTPFPSNSMILQYTDRTETQYTGVTYLSGVHRILGAGTDVRAMNGIRNYRVQNNQWGSSAPQYTDAADIPWNQPFFDFDVPIPAHELRDAGN